MFGGSNTEDEREMSRDISRSVRSVAVSRWRTAGSRERGVTAPGL